MNTKTPNTQAAVRNAVIERTSETYRKSLGTTILDLAEIARRLRAFRTGCAAGYDAALTVRADEPSEPNAAINPVCIDGSISINGLTGSPCPHCVKAVERYKRGSGYTVTNGAEVQAKALCENQRQKKLPSLLHS